MMSFKRVVTSILVGAMVFGMAAVALADDSTSTPAPSTITNPANSDTTVIPAQPGTDKQANQEARQQFKELLGSRRDKLKEQSGVLKSLRDEIKAKFEQIKALAAEYRQSGDRSNLQKLRVERDLVRSHLQVVRGETQANRQLWQDLKAAVKARNIKDAVQIADRLIANRIVKINALRDISNELDHIISDLGGGAAQPAAPATPAVPAVPTLN